MKQRRTARWLAPLAFLVAVTVAALLVRSGLQQGKQAKSTTTGTTLTQTTHRHTHEHAHKTKKRKAHAGGSYYTVQSGDTFSAIAAKLGTTSAQLEQLNPTVDPSALHVGERIRVK